MHFWASSNNTDDRIAFCLSQDWQIDMTQDWSISVDWHLVPPSPGVNGDCGIALVIAMEGDPGAAASDLTGRSKRTTPPINDQGCCCNGLFNVAKR
jgi:hypothetical protein